ncbi:hypothetical protein CMUS01_04897 [Colletotrichum musicola]|uniref:Uncharacterized protein n=1 Tax=Colletotrichum musicola TaxID=2175873 RepID=A0A8H6KUA5_9PEZI|nr:hypothetical protein CMUS01_04897 [Colletotrichum musicola]
MAAQQRPSCLLHAGGVLVKQRRASLAKDGLVSLTPAKRRFWIRPVVVRFGDRHLFLLAVASFCLTLCVFQGDVRLRYSNLMRQTLTFRNPRPRRNHFALGLTSRGRGASGLLLICPLQPTRPTQQDRRMPYYFCTVTQ